jgi:hypothetical protein
VEDGRSNGLSRAGRVSERRRKRAVSLAAKPPSILDFEDFIEGLDFLAELERDRLKIAGGEILDNVIKHGSPVFRRRIDARATLHGDAILLAFYFRSPGFAAFAHGAVARAGAAKPFFDPTLRRWRGIGLVMCRNLASKLRFRPGETVDRIFLEFDRRESAADRGRKQATAEVL